MHVMGEPFATVTRASKESSRFGIRDLSGGGARLVGDTRLFEGELVWIRFELDVPVEVAADVVRVDDQRKTADVTFRDVPPEAAAQIELAIAALIHNVREASPPTVLVLHPDVAVSSALERDLARIGVAARVLAGIASSGDLAWVLEDRAVKYIGVIVSGQLEETLGPSLAYLEEKQADLRRVVLYGDQILKSEHPAVGRVHAVLRTPWHFKGLTRALGVSMDNVVTTYDQLVALKLSDDD
jgi:hypothetical protein